MNNTKSYSLCHSILRKNNLYDYQIRYILAKSEKHMMQYQAYAMSKNNPEEMFCVKFNRENSYEFHKVAEWDFNVDGYLLDDLENGFHIDYMSLEAHYDVWCAIDDLRGEIDHQDGLQKYLSYCHMNGIGKHEISLLQLNEIDIMDLYKERNAGYTIIAEMQCGERAIVLAERKNNPEKFVTWKTHVDRRQGFDVGHYFSDFTHAYEDFEKRSHSMMDTELFRMKYKCRSNKQKEQER